MMSSSFVDSAAEVHAGKNLSAENKFIPSQRQSHDIHKTPNKIR